ncbi:hypothetical protein BDV95DRAFT_670992 [Massariosphaeria phaeospora]|uniref:Arrestin-like N-terminal domain-containing protein n=1 Tax=Massariosphaeria phaeospora TaxID=100035 RepID=A0A7C8I883_9PLEO|nr:hypothetical protein BDV95DRAFT_670992 [Massariosphaeria phaeospora]
MGLFGSSKDKGPYVPLPELSLQLANPPDKVFKPDSTVSGHITLIVPQPINPQAIEVSLWGLSKVWLRRDVSSSDKSSEYHHWRDHAPFFTVSHNLLEKPQQQLVPGQAYTFPFSFRVPEATANYRAGFYKQDNDGRWTSAPHALPPTFFWGVRPGQGIPDYAEISYGVTARLLCPGVGVGKNLDPIAATAPLTFSPLNPYLNPAAPLTVIRHPQTLTLQSSALTGASPSSLGFRQRLTDRFSSATPKLDFETALEIPDLLHSGLEFRFRASFAVLSKSGSVAHIPPITFRVLKLELRSLTHVRAPRDYNASSWMDGHHRGRDHVPVNGAYSGQEQTMYREAKVLLNAVPDCTTLVLDEVPVLGEKDAKSVQQAERTECWFVGRVPGTMPPSFVSWAVSRAYCVKVRVGVEVGGKKFEVEKENYINAVGSAPGEGGV